MAGTLVGSGFAAAIMTFAAGDAVDAWGWRVPFLAGGILGAIAYIYVRNVATMPHMEHHESLHENDSPLHEALTRNRRETLLGIVFAAGYGIVFYVPVVYLPTYASEVGNIGSDVALQLNAIAVAVSLPLIPAFGWVSDHWIRRRSLLLLGFLVTAACGWALVALAKTGLPGLAVTQLALSVLVAVPLGSAPAMLVELFPVADRLTAYSLAYNVGLGVAGGSAPMVSTWLISATGSDSAPGAYLTFAALVCAAALWLMQDRSREPLR